MPPLTLTSMHRWCRRPSRRHAQITQHQIRLTVTFLHAITTPVQVGFMQHAANEGGRDRMQGRSITNVLQVDLRQLRIDVTIEFNSRRIGTCSSSPLEPH